MLPLAAENRNAAGVQAGEEIKVHLKLDKEERTVEIPADLKEALDKDPLAKAAFEKLAFTHRKEHVRAIEDAKKPETRLKRLEKAMEMLRAGKKPS